MFDLEEYVEGAVFLTGLEGAIIGVVNEFGSDGGRILYSREKIIEILINRDEMSEDEAVEFYEYNILGLYAGERNAVFLDLEVIPTQSENGWEYNINE